VILRKFNGWGLHTKTAARCVHLHHQQLFTVATPEATATWGNHPGSLHWTSPLDNDSYSVRVETWS